MKHLDEIVERIRNSFDLRTEIRDQALARTRLITRYCANAIRAIHREDQNLARTNLNEAKILVKSLQADLIKYPDLYYAGYTQDALKEYVEAHITFALIQDNDLPEPEELGVEYATYLLGMAESTGELRRRCLDLLRNDHSEEAERLLSQMDDIYAILITMDYPDAVTCGLRRLTDIVRGVTERTRGDLTISLRQSQLEQSLQRLEDQLSRSIR